MFQEYQGTVTALNEQLAERDRAIETWADANRAGEAERVRMFEEYHGTVAAPNGQLAELQAAHATLEEVLQQRQVEIATWADANRAGEAERVRMFEEYQATAIALNEQ